MNKDICKYIANCTLCKREKEKMQTYPLQIMDIPDWPFHKITIDLATDLNVSMSGNQHILMIIDHLTGWSETFPIPNKKADTIFCIFINYYLAVYMCLKFILSNNGLEFKNQLMYDVLKQCNINCIFSTPYHPQSNRKLEVFHKYLNTHSKHCVRMTRITGTNTLTRYLEAIM